MRIARPAGGFQIQLSPGAKAYIDQACAESGDFARYWKDIEDRLRFTAHVEGVEHLKFEPGCRLWAAAPDPDRNLPRVKLLYAVVGSVVRIRVAHIG